MHKPVPSESRPLCDDKDVQVLRRLEQRHIAGDRLAAGECVVYCEEHNLPLLGWALTELADRWREFLAGDSPPGFALARIGTGRHADPRAERREQERQEVSVACLRAAYSAGFRGRDWIVNGGNLLDNLRPDDAVGTERMQRQFQLWQNGQASKAPIHDPNELLVVCSGELHRLLRQPLGHYQLVSGELSRG